MSDPADLYEQAEDLFKDGNYDGAAPLYDQAISLAPTNNRYRLNRALNSLKLRRWSAALSDCDSALASLSPSDSLVGRAHMRRGQALSHLDRYSEAKRAFQQAATNKITGTEIWLRKCEAELEREAEGRSGVIESVQEKKVVHKIEALPPQPKKQSTTAASSSASSSSAAAASSASAGVAATPAVPTGPLNLAQKVREQWFQSLSDVCITLLAKNLKQEQAHVQHDSASHTVKVSIDMSDGSKYERSWRLWAAVQGEPQMVLTAYKVELTFLKQDQGNWGSLERKEGEGPAAAPVVKRENVYRDDINMAAYPTSAKSLKNWEEVEQVAKKQEEEEKPDGEAALQKLFQSIYANADPDTRRAMIKSFQTSGGTVLSTNWDEVKAKDYEKEVQAPAGQQVKKWNDRDLS